MSKSRDEAFVLSGLDRAWRAASEIAAARPVVIVGPDGSGHVALASEHITGNRLAAFRTLGTLRILLTHVRAAHLRLRLYTPEAVSLLACPDWDAPLLKSLADPSLDMDRPLHGPLEAERDALAPGLVAAMRLVRLAGALPSALSAEVADASEFAARAGLLAIPAASVPDPATLGDPGPLDVELVTQARLPVAGAPDAQLLAFRGKPSLLWGTADEQAVHYALAIGTPDPGGAPLVRLHSECFTGDLLGSLKCDCGDQLRGAVERIAKEGSGLLLYLRQEGRGIGLLNKLRAYHLQDQGVDTLDANLRLGFNEDERSFRPAIRMLEAMGLKRVRLLTNNPLKVAALEAGGIAVAERVGHSFPANPHNAHYLATKRIKSGHAP